MSSLLIPIAQAVTDLLNQPESQTSLGQEFSATRCYVPNYDKAKSPGLQVFVVPPGRVTDLASGTRAETLDTYTIAIVVYRQIDRDPAGQPSASQMDAMIEFMDGLIELLKQQKEITDYAAWEKIENQPTYDPVSLDAEDTFMSFVAINYRCFCS